MALHWIMAALIVWNLASMMLTPQAWARTLLPTHMAVGLTVLLLSLVRLLWRLTHRWPPLPATIPLWERRLARGSHALFYVLMLAVPLSGWLMVSASSGRAVNWFGVASIPPLPVASSRYAVAAFYEMHEIGATLMAGLLLLHVAGALRHSLPDGGTPLLLRMLPRRSAYQKKS